MNKHTKAFQNFTRGPLVRCINLPDHDCIVDTGRGQDVVEGTPGDVEDVSIVSSKRGPQPPVLDVNFVAAAEDGPAAVSALLPDHDLGETN